MSTAGKVLTVLVSLMAVVWILLVAAVAQHNRAGAKAVNTLQVQVAKLEADVAASARSLQDLKDQTFAQQRQTQLDLTMLQSRQAEVERKRSEYLEIATRARIQLADVEAMVKSAEAHGKEREDEKAAETKALADTRASVERLKGENADLLARLTSLRNKFASTLKENKALVDRLNKASAGTTRPASLSR